MASRVAAFSKCLVLLALVSAAAAQRKRPPRPQPAQPQTISLEVLWALAARGPNDPFGNKTDPGSARLLVGAPKLERKQCKADPTVSWVATLQPPRYVDVRFEIKPSIVAMRIASIQVLLLNRGALKPVISSIELMLASPGNTSASGAAISATPLLLYEGSGSETLACPALNTFALPAGVLTTELPGGRGRVRDAIVLGVRLNVSAGTVASKSKLPSIGAVGLQLLPKK